MSEISVLENSRVLVIDAANECSAKCIEALKYGRQEELDALSLELSKLHAAIDVINNRINTLSARCAEPISASNTLFDLKDFL